jgi:hypothetical protein
MLKMDFQQDIRKFIMSTSEKGPAKSLEDQLRQLKFRLWDYFGFSWAGFDPDLMVKLCEACEDAWVELVDEAEAAWRKRGVDPHWPTIDGLSVRIGFTRFVEDHGGPERFGIPRNKFENERMDE